MDVIIYLQTLFVNNRYKFSFTPSANEGRKIYVITVFIFLFIFFVIFKIPGKNDLIKLKMIK